MEEIKELSQYLSLRQSAKELGISKEGVRLLIVHNELYPVHMVDGFYLIPRKTLDKFIKNRKSKAITNGRYKIK